MSEAKHLFKQALIGVSIILLAVIGTTVPVYAAAEPDSAEFKKAETGLYSDIFNQNIYYEAVDYLNFEKLYQRIFHKKVRSANANVYDEVPDSTFFTNRHGRKRLTSEELTRGPSETDGPSQKGRLVITKGKFNGLHPGFFIKDEKGDGYLLKFDSPDNLEMATSAETIASRIYHAVGYNVPQYSVYEFKPDRLVPAAEATAYDNTGFKKILTPEALEEYLLFVPYTSEGMIRACASKLLKGENKGSFNFRSRRRNDPNDPIDHRDRRELRALRVFSSWVNNTDIRKSNTLEMLVQENGQPVLKHYLIDFNSALGSAADGTKPPMFGYEHILDYGEATKAFATLGLREKPWQKRWKAEGEMVNQSSAVGYFDGQFYNPARYKGQYPAEAFKILTRADGFWAAKIIMSFTDEDIRSIVKAGRYSSPGDEKAIADILIARRDITGKYWFSQAAPLDEFDLQKGKLVFQDLAVEYGFEKSATTTYHVDVTSGGRKKKNKIAGFESNAPAFSIDPSWFENHEAVDLVIRVMRENEGNPSPFVLVRVDSKNVLSIVHQD
ncbi:MAG: hypothetical protein H6757_03465 [Candidatus Omnitrophica bacterium]|nr:hypothetical protein [Candidatus Omnitrophota bacterium]